MSIKSKNPFVSNTEVRWCPGCGDYAILATLQKLLPNLKVTPENTVFISGIGCAGRLPYYMETYGLHGIHGRAPAIATGLKLKRPELATWVITGDGDGLSIGVSHLLHLMRRNINVTILLFNNQIYGLTKGQYSPTSPQGVKNKVTPQGSLDQPFNPISLALAAGCSFVARGIDVDTHGLASILTAAHAHPGTAFVEILQNCNVFNDRAFSDFTDKRVRSDRCLFLEAGEPMRFGAAQNKGLTQGDDNNTTDFFKIVALGDNTSDLEGVLRHDLRQSIALSDQLARMDHPKFPVAFGVIRAVTRPVFEQAVALRTRKSTAPDELQAILHSGQTWTV